MWPVCVWHRRHDKARVQEQAKPGEGDGLGP